MRMMPNSKVMKRLSAKQLMAYVGEDSVFKVCAQKEIARRKKMSEMRGEKGGDNT